MYQQTANKSLWIKSSAKWLNVNAIVQKPKLWYRANLKWK